MPPFLPVAWETVLRQSKTEGKFIVVYLHSAAHADARAFCEGVLCHPTVVRYLREEERGGGLSCWGADVAHRGGSAVAGYLSACVYPFLAVCILHRQTGALFVLDRIEGLSGLQDDASNPNAAADPRNSSNGGSSSGGGRRRRDASLPNRLVARLRATFAKHQPVAAETRQVNRAERMRREEIARQDQQFQDALAADQRREREELERAARVDREREEAEREQEEAETAAQLQEAVALSLQLSRQNAAEQKRAALPPEPASARGCTKLKVRLPEGAPVTRKFDKHTTIGVVRDWVFVELVAREEEMKRQGEEGALVVRNFRINCNMPRCSFGDGDEDAAETLESTGLHPNAMLYVQDLDS